MTLATEEFSSVKPCVHWCKPEQYSHAVNSFTKCVGRQPQYQGGEGECERQLSPYGPYIPVGLGESSKQTTPAVLCTAEKINRRLEVSCDWVRLLWIRWSDNFSVEVKFELKPA